MTEPSASEGWKHVDRIRKRLHNTIPSFQYSPYFRPRPRLQANRNFTVQYCQPFKVQQLLRVPPSLMINKTCNVCIM